MKTEDGYNLGNTDHSSSQFYCLHIRWVMGVIGVFWASDKSIKLLYLTSPPWHSVRWLGVRVGFGLWGKIKINSQEMLVRTHWGGWCGNLGMHHSLWAWHEGILLFQVTNRSFSVCDSKRSPCSLQDSKASDARMPRVAFFFIIQATTNMMDLFFFILCVFVPMRTCRVLDRIPDVSGLQKQFSQSCDQIKQLCAPVSARHSAVWWADVRRW